MSNNAGSLLVRAGLISQADLVAGMRQQSAHGGTLAEHLVAAGLVDEERLCNFFRDRLLVPRMGPGDLDDLAPGLLDRVPSDMAAEFRVIPAQLDRDGSLVLAMVDPMDTHAVNEISFYTGTSVLRVVNTVSRIVRALERYYQIRLPHLGRVVESAAARGLAVEPPKKPSVIAPTAKPIRGRTTIPPPALASPETPSIVVAPTRLPSPAPVVPAPAPAAPPPLTAPPAPAAPAARAPHPATAPLVTVPAAPVAPAAPPPPVAVAAAASPAVPEAVPTPLVAAPPAVAAPTPGLPPTRRRRSSRPSGETVADSGKTRIPAVIIDEAALGPPPPASAPLPAPTPEVAPALTAVRDAPSARIVVPPSRTPPSPFPLATDVSSTESGVAQQPVRLRVPDGAIPLPFRPVDEVPRRTEPTPVSAAEPKPAPPPTVVAEPAVVAGEVTEPGATSLEAALAAATARRERPRETTPATSVVAPIGPEPHEAPVSLEPQVPLEPEVEAAVPEVAEPTAAEPAAAVDTAPPAPAEELTGPFPVDDTRVADEALVRVLADLQATGDRDSVSATLVSFIGATCRRAAFFVVKKGILAGWQGMGPGVTQTGLNSAVLSLDSPSILRDVVTSQLPYSGPVEDNASRDFLIEALGWAPAEMLAVPVMVRGRVVGVLYGDEAFAALPPGHLVTAARAAEAALERAVASRKSGPILTPTR